MNMNCFDGDIDPGNIDRKGFLFHHKLLGHPALSLDNLAQAIPRLPADQVFHSNGKLANTDNFDRAHIDHRPAMGLEATLQELRTTDAYIMVRKPETDPSFKDLMSGLLADVKGITSSAGIKGGVDDAMLYLFIASPNSVTPFHIDRYSTFLMQFRGSKVVTVYPPWNRKVVDDEDAEHFFAKTGRRPVWRPESEGLGHAFDFSPGEALHIPFAAGHHVRNGSDDVSISLSIIFKTAQTRQLMRAMQFNHYARRGLAPVGLTPRRVALGAPGLASKSVAWHALSGCKSLVDRASGRLSRILK